MSWTDEEMLMALHLREAERLPMAEIAQHLGKSRSAVIGMVNRLLKIANAPDPTAHLNGTMGPLWWQKRRAAHA